MTEANIEIHSYEKLSTEFYIDYQYLKCINLNYLNALKNI
jgi:hypothetical protein